MSSQFYQEYGETFEHPVTVSHAKRRSEGQEGTHSTSTTASRSYSLKFISKNLANPFSNIKHSSWWVKQPFLSSPPFLNCFSLLQEKTLRLPCPECLALVQAALNEVLATPWHCRRLSSTANSLHQIDKNSGQSSAWQHSFYSQNKETNRHSGISYIPANPMSLQLFLKKSEC